MIKIAEFTIPLKWRENGGEDPHSQGNFVSFVGGAWGVEDSRTW
jgi:hypothetical protein